MVPPGKVTNLESDLTGLNYTVMIPDVQKLIDLEKKASSSAGLKVNAGKQKFTVRVEGLKVLSNGKGASTIDVIYGE